MLYRLGKTAFRRWPLVLAGWLVAIIAVGAVAATMSKPMTDAFSIPGIPSEKAADLQSELFPTAVDAFDQASVNVVVAAPRGHTLDEPAYAEAVDDLVAGLGTVPQVAEGGAPLANPVAAAQGQLDQVLAAARKNGMPRAQAEANAQALSPLSRDGRVGTITFTYDVDTPTDVSRPPATGSTR